MEELRRILFELEPCECKNFPLKGLKTQTIKQEVSRFTKITGKCFRFFTGRDEDCYIIRLW